MDSGGGCLVVAGALLIGWAALIAASATEEAVDSREANPKSYQEVLDMDNEHTANLIQACMKDGKLSVSELNAIRKLFNETSGPQAELERRYGE